MEVEARNGNSAIGPTKTDQETPMAPLKPTQDRARGFQKASSDPSLAVQKVLARYQDLFGYGI